MTKDTMDRDLAAALARGDKQAFAALYRQHYPVMLRVCAAFLGSRATAEEVVQDTWVAVLTSASNFEGRSSLASWIFAIMFNKARSRIRRDQRSVSFDQDGDDHGLNAAFDGHGRWSQMPDLWEQVSPDRIVEGRDMMAHVNDAIDSLPPAQRAVLVLWCHQDLDGDEICRLLNISEGNMRVLLHRARIGLRKKLDLLLRSKGN